MIDPNSAVPAVDEAARRRHTRHLILVGAITGVVVTAIGLFEEGVSPTPTDVAVQLGFTTVGVAVAIVVLLVLRRRGVDWLQPPPPMAMDRAERKAASRALRPGGTVTAEYRASTVQVARYLGRYRWAPWFFAGMAALSAWLWVTETGPMRWYWMISGPAFLLTAGYYVFALRRADAIVRAEYRSGFGSGSDFGSGWSEFGSGAGPGA